MSPGTPISSSSATPARGRIQLKLWAEWQLIYLGDAAWSPDGEYIVFADDNMRGTDDWVYMFNVDTLQPVWKINDEMSSISFSPDRGTIVSAGTRLRFFDAESGKLLASPYEGNAQLLPAFLPDGTALLVGRTWVLGDQDALTEVGVWDDDERNLDIIIDHEGSLGSIDIRRDGRQLATSFGLLPDVENGFGVILWDLGTRSEYCNLLGENAIFSPTGDLLATTSGGTVTFVDSATCQPLRTIHDAEYLSTIGFSPDGSMVATAGIPFGTIWIHDVATGELLYRLEGLDDNSMDLVAFSPDGRFLLSVSQEAVQVWSVAIPER
jgi:WD40 repeat protein